jgi:hypothetical protein
MFSRALNPTEPHLPALFVSRAWHMALALGKGADMKDVVKRGFDEHFKPLQATGGVELPSSAPKRELTKEELDRRVVEEERNKHRARLASAGKVE